MTMLAMYEDGRAAARGVQRLIESSFDAQRIQVVFFDRDGPERASVAHATGMPVGAALGAVFGAVAGGTAVVTCMVVAPGVLQAHPLWVLAMGTLGGCAAGALAGCLTGLAFWKKRLDLPDTDAEGGGVLVAVPARSNQRREQARSAFESSGAAVVFAR